MKNDNRGGATVGAPPPCRECDGLDDTGSHADRCPKANRERAARGRRIIDEYAAECGVDEANLCDLLADLMHMAPTAEWDFDAELERARHHYEAERVEAAAAHCPACGSTTGNCGCLDDPGNGCPGPMERI